MTENKPKNVTVRVPEGTHKPARVKIAQMDSSFQEVLLGLLVEWAEGKREAARVEGPPPSFGRNGKWHELLDEILNDPQERIGIEKNLQWAVDSMRGRKLVSPSRGVVRRAGR